MSWVPLWTSRWTERWVDTMGIMPAPAPVAAEITADDGATVLTADDSETGLTYG